MNFKKNLFLFLIFFSVCVYAQNEDDRTILNIFLKSNKDSTIYLVRESVGWSRIEEILNEKQFIENTGIKISKKEIRKLKKQIVQYKNYNWDSKLFENVKILSQDSMLPLSKEYRSKWVKENGKKIDKDGIWLPQALSYTNLWVNGFSKPIYLRGNSISLVYHFEICGANCGYNEIYLLKKEKGVWTKWLKIEEGAF